MSEDYIWETAEEFWGQLEPENIPLGYIQSQKIRINAINYEGGIKLFGADGEQHMGI